MKKIILPFVILLFIGCSKDEANEYPILIEPILIADASLYGNGSEGIIQSNKVISNQTEWQNLIIQLDSNSNVSNDFNELDIDFNQYQVIAIFDQIRGSGENSIYITEITENKTNIKIKIDSSQLGIATVITQPFYIVKILKTEKDIVFE